MGKKKSGGKALYMGQMVNVFNPSTMEAEAVDLSESEAILAYILSSRPARATQI